MNILRPPGVLVNAVAYQLVWLACVAGTAAGATWVGPIAALLFAVLMLGFGGKRRADLRALVVVLPVGIALDSAFATSGWLSYVAGWSGLPGLAPAWIVAIWAGFALTLNHSLLFLSGRPLLAAALGLVGGPLAYSAARGFDVVSYGAPAASVLLALGLAWAAALPLLVALNRPARQLVRGTA